eukprot:GFUD01048906.1.p1 GENE.GFUD01048906.1~~GFUD01048906.1.p1  ORF type:complete len:115 (+),score=30.12 GFUD01048906.1:82-426(+)
MPWYQGRWGTSIRDRSCQGGSSPWREGPGAGGRVQPLEGGSSPWRVHNYQLKKYEVKKENIQKVFLKFEINKVDRQDKAAAGMKDYAKYLNERAPKVKECHKIDVKACEPAIGP